MDRLTELQPLFDADEAPDPVAVAIAVEDAWGIVLTDDQIESLTSMDAVAAVLHDHGRAN